MIKKRISFKISHLKSLLDSESSCVTLVNNFKGKLFLLPFHLGYLKVAVKELLDNKVSNYDPELNGIILGHSNIKVINSLSYSDSGDIYLGYIADVFLFTPSVGQTLTGVINKKSKEHIGCLIHSAFNASIPKPRTGGQDLSVWLRTQGSVQIGGELDFTITKVDFTTRVPYISGVIIRTDHDCNEEEVDSGIGCQDSIDEGQVKIKKKKRKSKGDQHTTNGIDPENEFISHLDPNEITELLNSENALKPVKKNKSKNKTAVDINDGGCNLRDPSLKKVKKERVCLEDDSEASGFNKFEEDLVKETNPSDTDCIPFSLDKVKRKRTSVSPLDTDSTSTKKKSIKHFDENQSYNLKKVKKEQSLDELTASMLQDAINSSVSSSDSDRKKKRKKRREDSIDEQQKSSPAQSEFETFKKSKKKLTLDSVDFFTPKLESEMSCRKRKRSDSPIKSPDFQDESISKTPKKKKSKRSGNDLDKLTNLILADVVSKMK